jgi:putative flavoprotein involved in K+ transport
VARSLIARVGMQKHYPVIVVGAGQAGLAISHCLVQRKFEHVVLERHRVGHAWRTQRWDSFCLVTPNWQCRLPGYPYAGSDPHGFMRKDQVVRYLEGYAAAFEPPLHEGVEVRRVRKAEGARFVLETSLGDLRADQVVIAAGGYHQPKIPTLAKALPSEVVQLHSASYRCSEQLPEGAVLVVGSGQSGCQIAEDLHIAGREVHLCVGSAPRAARRYRGKDVVEWLELMGHYDLPIDQHPDGRAVRKKSNHYVTGRDGGRDIDLRKLANEGMRLHGRLLDVTAAGLELGDDLAQNLDRADASCERIKDNIDAFIEREGLSAPTEPRYVPRWFPTQASRRISFGDAGIRTVIWCMGFALDFRWIDLPVLDASGYPEHARGVTAEPGLYFLGLPWLHTWGSGRFGGVGRDAMFLAERIAAAADAGLGLANGRQHLTG